MALSRIRRVAEQVLVEEMVQAGNTVRGGVAQVFCDAVRVLHKRMTKVAGVQRCFHDLRSGGHDGLVKDLESELRSAPQTPRPTSRVDPAPLLERIRRRLWSSPVAVFGLGWENSSYWEGKVREAHAKCAGEMQRIIYETLVEEYARCGYQDIVDRPGAILAIASRLFAVSPTAPSSTTISDPQLAQLIRFCQSHVLLRNAILSVTHPFAGILNPVKERVPPTLRVASSSLLSSLPRPLLPSSSNPRSTFDRFAKIKTTDHPSIPRLVFPRYCPPDLCSGRTPLLENYEVLDRDLRASWIIATFVSSITVVHTSMQAIRQNSLWYSFPFLRSFDCTTVEQQSRLLAQIDGGIRMCAEQAEEDDHVDPVSVLEIIHKHAGLFAESAGGAKRMLCICELTHVAGTIVPTLLDGINKDFSINDLRLQLAATLPLDSSESFPNIAAGVENGIFSQDCWKAPDWRSKFEAMMLFLNEPVIARILIDHHSFTPDDCRIASALSSSRILEELSSLSPPRAPKRSISFAHFDMLSDALASTISSHQLSSSAAKSKGDSYVKASNIKASIDQYDYSTMLDSTNFSARTNSAAARLVLANDTDQSHQWSRAIYDCSAALYYGPPSFKAYYRRGYALAHLKLFDKAILDFEQALLVEPHNVVAQIQLHLAKKKSKAKATRSR